VVTQEVQVFTEKISLVDSNIKITRESAKDNKLPFLEDGNGGRWKSQL